jgi:(p)ppGpp synthase/HD superfamily hydrolase
MNEKTLALHDDCKILFSYLATKYSLKAIEIADEAHKGQKRKFTGEDYINHPVMVARRVIDFENLPNVSIAYCLKKIDEHVAIAVCHDVFEDTSVKIEDVEDIFTPYILTGFIALTRMKGENYFDFIMRIKETPYYQIKIFDLEDNMSDLADGSLKDKYRLAKHILNLNGIIRK